MQWIDVRSDTVTQPTEAMRHAMASAMLGDDVYGDDPCVNRLEAEAAERLGKEAALFVPSGTMGNQLAILTHCRPGNEVIVDDDSHIVWHEAGAAALIAGVQLRTLQSQADGMAPEEIARRIRVGNDIHCPKTGLICLENAHSNGRVIPLANMRAIYQLAQQHQIPLHLDGARLFNAATYLGVAASELARQADSVMFCLSKGLAAPVGSMLVGTQTFIRAARRNRKALGGGMRQAGVLAAPGLIALNEMTQRLEQDHQHARLLAEALAPLPGIKIDLSAVQINLVWFELSASVAVEPLMAALHQAHISANPPEAGRMRFATHWQVGRPEVERILTVMRSVLAA